MAALGEFSFIKKYLAPLAQSTGAAGLEDDAATLSPRNGYDLVISKDMLASQVHFFADDAPEDIAAKVLRVNVSDIIAKGAKPLGYFMGLGLPVTADDAFMGRFVDGLKRDMLRYGLDLLGGDTIKTGTGQLVISISMFGEVPTGRVVRRTTAQAGALLYVTGNIGDSALGLCLRRDDNARAQWQVDKSDIDYLLGRYLRPEPRIEAHEIIREYALASMDISDGLVADLGHMCQTSEVGAQVELSRIPLSHAGQRVVKLCPDAVETVVTGGDDYEVLMAVLPENASEFETAMRQCGVRVTQIGKFVESKVTFGSCEPVFYDNQQVVTFSKRGYAHF
ncbi:thiamine-phosphate kinase [Polycladidibacter stylochi]|uniref:thiamine-phosphate kinase n=1 Tax=Polycladidibacter stylochi TaxID=1807766 RepID=UPI00082AA60D|nr:thiamine-phosphate kinase [Pseudovibrio stylochi]